ncbi:glycoside hydrolase family 1 protein [Candidatus Pacebacteria bacterium]|nr:glycoside hydrolase family 1 protein [Candidatus Paceibacterota bacterium]
MSKRLEFPKGFFWGAASASYQVEGNIYNTDWAFEARNKKRVPVADSGPDHFNRYEEDFDIAKSLGHNCHRFSIEWSRIEPAEGEFSIDGIRHYEKVLRALKKRNLEPFVTLWHFTLPQWLSEKGGTAHPKFPEYFSRYAAFVSSNLADYCTHWATINEPLIVSGMGYLSGNWPPHKKHRYLQMYIVIKNLIKAHKLAYEEIKQHDFVSDVGIVKHQIYFHNESKNPINFIKEKLGTYFWNYYFLNKVHNHCDSIGLNYYQHKGYGDKNIYKKNDMHWELYPSGIYHVLKQLKKYNKPVFISEAGIADHSDMYREQYVKDLITNIHHAISDGVPVKGYMYWSLTDNYEWAHGYKERFGLVEIDYETKERHIRESAYAIKEIYKNNYLEIK